MVSAAAASSQAYARPADDASRSMIDAPTTSASARVMTTAPTLAAMPANGSTVRRFATSPPNAASAVTAMPIASARPRYRSVLPTTASGEGPGAAAGAAAGAACTSPGSTPTPKAKTPGVRCPSASETTTHETVYTPSPRSPGSSSSSERAPAPRRNGPVSTTAPPASSTVTDDRSGSGGSVNDIVIDAGAAARVAPSAGSDETNAACADAAGASATTNTDPIAHADAVLAMHRIASLRVPIMVSPSRTAPPW